MSLQRDSSPEIVRLMRRKESELKIDNIVIARPPGFTVDLRKAIDSSR